MSKQNKPPKFHHYVPKTYLKHWLDEDDLIYIYDKKSGKIRPSSINGQYFGKNNLNTITYPDNTKGYWVETAYAELECKISPALNKIAASLLSGHSDITHEDKLMLSLFISAQFWRLPTNKGLVKDLIESGDFSDIGLSVTNSNTREKLSSDETASFYSDITSTDLFQKAYPALRPLLDMTKENAFDALRDWSFYYQHPGFNLTSDNPILYFTEPTTSSILSDFILPLSPGVLLISKEFPPDTLDSSMSTDLNILQVCHANQFIAGTNETYLRSLADEYEQNFQNIPLEEVEKYVYDKILKTSHNLIRKY